jgi:hypothetical protein
MVTESLQLADDIGEDEGHWIIRWLRWVKDFLDFAAGIMARSFL